MKKITIGSDTIYEDTEHLVLVVTQEPILLDFIRAVDDLLISSPDGDLLIAWKLGHDSDWNDKSCLLISQKDNLKEISGIKTSLLALKARDMESLTVYVTIQRN